MKLKIKFPDVSRLVNKIDYDAKIKDNEKHTLLLLIIIHLCEMLDAKIKQKELVNKSDIFNLVKRSDLNAKPVTLATKADLKAGKIKL